MQKSITSQDRSKWKIFSLQRYKGFYTDWPEKTCFTLDVAISNATLKSALNLAEVFLVGKWMLANKYKHALSLQRYYILDSIHFKQMLF